MIHLPRRYFHQAMNERHYKKEKKMGGYIGLESDKSEYIRGQVTPEHKVQEAVDSLNAAIDRLDGIIKEMQGNCECQN